MERTSFGLRSMYLIKTVTDLKRAERYPEAVREGEKLLALIQRHFGPNQVNVGTSLKNLADLYRDEPKVGMQTRNRYTSGR